MCESLEKRNLNYTLRRFFTPFSKFVAYELKSLIYVAGKVWSIVPFEIRNDIGLEEFSAKIKSWTTENCECWVCLSYLHQVGCI